MEADAFQTTACWWLSVAALIGVGLNGLLGWWWADPISALVIALAAAAASRSRPRKGCARYPDLENGIEGIVSGAVKELSFHGDVSFLCSVAPEALPGGVKADTTQGIQIAVPDSELETERCQHWAQVFGFSAN